MWLREKSSEREELGKTPILVFERYTEEMDT